MAKVIKLSKKEIPAQEIQNNVQLIRAFNNYTQLWEVKEMIKWLIDYLTDVKPELVPYVNSGRYHYNSPVTGITSITTVCKMARLVQLGVDIPECNKERLDEIISHIHPVEKVKEEKPVIDYGEPVNFMHWQLDEAEDAAARGERAYVILPPDVPQAHVDEVVARAKKSLESLEDTFVVSSDDCGNEKPWSPVIWKFLKALYSGIIAQVTTKDNKPKAVRQQKKKPLKPSQLAKIADAFTHMKHFGDLNLTSIHPLKIIDAEEVWLYNTQSRKLTFLKGQKLNIKGVSVLGFDKDESYSLTLRLREKVLGPDVNRDFVLKAVKDLLDSGRKRQDANGRSSPHTVIVAAFRNGNQL